MPGVFISYRREDSGYVGRLFDVLSARFGRSNIFMDIDTIEGGEDFAAVIEEKIKECDALVAVIGKGWLTSTGQNGGRRLDDARDYVRLEIAKALIRMYSLLWAEQPSPYFAGGVGSTIRPTGAGAP